MSFSASSWAFELRRFLKYNVRGMLYAGTGRYCPVCEKTSRKFGTYGEAIKRPEAQCMHCGALERHRLIWRYLGQETDLFDKHPKKMLHIAPEPCFQSRLKGRLGSTYITADLNNSRVNVKMDITDIQYPDDSFDVIYCSHVLEHVPDDRKAMRELCRVLKSDGWALLVVPISLSETIEDPTITDPLERQRLFGLKDHVRKYGTDFEDRLRQAGFSVTPISASDFLQQDEIQQIRINQSYRIHHCTKSPLSMLDV